MVELIRIVRPPSLVGGWIFTVKVTALRRVEFLGHVALNPSSCIRAAGARMGTVRPGTDAATDPHLLKEQAYRDDTNLRARQGLLAYAVKPVDLWWRLAPVEWRGTERVLDVGCGNGIDTKQLLARRSCAQVVATDLSAGMLRTLGLGEEPGLPVHLLQSDIAALPFKDESYDVVLAMHMLYHVADISAALTEVRRVLADDGVFLASTNSAASKAALQIALNDAVSGVVGRNVVALPELAFTTENGRQLLEQTFASVELSTYATNYEVTNADVVVAAGASSVRDPVVATIGELDWNAVINDYRAHVEQIIKTEGSFKITATSGDFICRP